MSSDRWPIIPRNPNAEQCTDSIPVKREKLKLGYRIYRDIKAGILTVQKMKRKKFEKLDKAREWLK